MEPDGGRCVQAAQPVVGQDAVLTRDGDDVGGDAHGAEVEQGGEFVELDAVALGKGLHELEAHAAAREVGAGVVVVGAFRVEHGHGGGHGLVGDVVVADDEVDAQRAGIGDLVDGLDAAVEHDDESDAHLGGVVHPLARDAVSLVVAVGDVEVHVRVELAQETVDQRYGRAAVDVVVAVDHDAFLAPHGLVEAVDGGVHVVHQERVGQFGELGAEETARLGRRRDAAAHEELAQNGMDTHFAPKDAALFFLLGRGRFVVPFVVHCMFCFFVSADFRTVPCRWGRTP